MNANGETQQPFSEVLDRLFTAVPLPLAQLYWLSDLADQDLTEFCRRWGGVADERRQIIIRHLADLSEENFIVDFAPIFEYALADSYPAVRQAALDGLWDATNVRLIPAIIQMLKVDDDVDVRAAAAAALAHFVLLVEWGQLPARVSPPIVTALLETYEAPETADPIKRAALEALGPSPHPQLPELISAAYESNNFEMQLSAVFAMGSSADNRWLPIILDEMENLSADMRAESARAAGTVGGSDAVEALANLLVDEDLSVAVAAVEAMGQIGGGRVQEILESLLDDNEDDNEFEALHDAIAEALEELALLGDDLDFDWLNIDSEL